MSLVASLSHRFSVSTRRKSLRAPPASLASSSNTARTTDSTQVKVGRPTTEPPVLVQPSRRVARQSYWDLSSPVPEELSVYGEETIIEGLAWRLELLLDISPPYGLIVPEMVWAARQDPNICGPALNLLWSAIYTDAESPVCEIPLVKIDTYGLKHADYTIPITSYNAPESLRHILYKWEHLARRLRRIEPRFHVDIARIICDMDPLESPLVPEVMRVADDMQKLAEDLTNRRLFFDYLRQRTHQSVHQGYSANTSDARSSSTSSASSGTETSSENSTTISSISLVS
ncbi:SubName: Full=Uncharacterized protein {ECO:0000313/EMBL:CCA69034.1} [Serendipita indica DSM 11827]|uniref:Uncharacterized protein n=1 Tax=Serendipita indica (strain DSM 11827) TaxID=1109443 RepID=G4TCI1_SERID|nr:SubName: Full=Uncharacterized protein {ECO:0000313/EMBL:CCA69034.1} [Serendipita indica DSM 11827]CCA69034.1 hypothetical protein PIIN_02893 [Serendipita indica DSM 11827]